MDDLGTFERQGDTVELHYERCFPRPINAVWEALTDPARLEDWLGQALVEPCLGGRYELFVERKRPMTGQITAWEPPTSLAFSWDTGDGPPSIVRCALARDGDRTRLLFLHGGVGPEWIGLVLPGWHVHLERLGRLLSGDIAPMDMARWRELQGIYVTTYGLDGVMLDPPAGHSD